MKIPNSERKKALFLVDIQSAFVNKRNEYVIKNIQNLLEQYPYDVYIVALFHAEKGSLWDKEEQWICPQDKNFFILNEVKELLQSKKVYPVEKQTKSVFKGNRDIVQILKDHSIEEIHLVGFDINDCILASAYEAFDFGYFTYVIEECCESSESEKIFTDACDILREQNMTNNSIVEGMKSIEIL